jgi:hypothetical protein
VGEVIGSGHGGMGGREKEEEAWRKRRHGGRGRCIRKRKRM